MQHQQAMRQTRETKESYGSTLLLLQADHTRALDEADSRHETVIKELKTKLSKLQQTVMNEVSLEMTALQEQHSRELDQVTQAQRLDVEGYMQTRHIAELADMGKRIREVHVTQLERIRVEHNEEMRIQSTAAHKREEEAVAYERTVHADTLSSLMNKV